MPFRSSGRQSAHYSGGRSLSRLTSAAAIHHPNSKLETGRRTSATVRHSSAPKTGATCKRNLRQLDFEVLVPTTILGGNSQIRFHITAADLQSARRYLTYVPNACTEQAAKLYPSHFSVDK